MSNLLLALTGYAAIALDFAADDGLITVLVTCRGSQRDVKGVGLRPEGNAIARDREEGGEGRQAQIDRQSHSIHHHSPLLSTVISSVVSEQSPAKPRTKEEQLEGSSNMNIIYIYSYRL